MSLEIQVCVISNDLLKLAKVIVASDDVSTSGDVTTVGDILLMVTFY